MPRLPSSQDIPAVSPRVMTDPGLSVPKQVFESPVGIAAQELAPAIEKYAQVVQLQQNRRDTIDRAGLINAKNLENDAKLRDINTQSDLSNEKVMAEYGSFLAQRRQELLKQHQERGASSDSLASLEARLIEVDDSHIGRAAEIAAQIGLDKVDERFKNVINTLALKVSTNPSLENINKTMGEFDVQFQDMKDAYDPVLENSRRAAGKEHLALSSLDGLLVLGKTDVADSLLREGGLSQFLSDSSQRQVQHRIDTINASKKDKESIATKPVFNKTTGELQFATDKQIVTDPNLVPVEAGKDDKITPVQRTAAGFAKRMEDAAFEIDRVGHKFTGVQSRIGGSFLFPEEFKSEERQIFEQAKRNFTNAVLRKESGAVISPSEFKSAELQYFPMPGNSQAVLDRKKRNRDTSMQAIKLEAGPAFNQLKESLPPLTVKIKGKDFLVGSEVINSKGLKGIVNQDGSITVRGK